MMPSAKRSSRASREFWNTWSQNIEKGIKKVLEPLGRGAIKSDSPTAKGSGRASIADSTDTQIQKPARLARYDGSVSMDVSRRTSINEDGETIGVRHTKSDYKLFRSYPTDLNKNIASLLALCDSMRASISQIGNFEHDPEADRLIAYLDAALAKEKQGTSTIKFDVLYEARLDKLLTDIIDLAARQSGPSAKLLAVTTTAEILQRLWKARFGNKYALIDQQRFQTMTTTGALKEIAFAGLDAAEQGVWTAKANTLALDLEPDSSFRTGQWWLNIACAYRDGIVGNEVEMPTKGRFGIVALPLLTGEEKRLPDGKLRYMRQGQASDMYFSLLTQVGRQICILRGHRLQSEYAPAAGVRYDGFWTIRQHGHKLDANTDVYHLNLVIERVDGQKSMDELQMIPKPSQLDDWRLYEAFEADEIKEWQRREDTIIHRQLMIEKTMSKDNRSEVFDEPREMSWSFPNPE